MTGEGISLVRLTHEHVIKPFDCGDADLNEFLLQDSKEYLSSLLAVTYLLENESDTIAFFSLSNDRISAVDVPNPSQWKKFKKKFVRAKQFRNYPCVKIGRLGVSTSFASKGTGTQILDYIKVWFLDANKTGCRFITVDAYRQSLSFYEKNGFLYLTSKDEEDDTRLMYFDLKDFADQL